MARKDLPTLGVDLNEREIRVVEVRYRGGKPYVSNAGAKPMPDGAYARAVIQHPAAVALALRGLLDEMGVPSGAKAVFGVENERVAFRQLAVPAAPDNDLPAIVSVEADHIGLVRSARGSYGFFKLEPAHAVAHESMNVIVLGVEEDVTGAIGMLADAANLSVEAVEPTSLAMLRAAYASMPGPATSLVITLGGLSSEAAFAVTGKLMLYRRMDVGSGALSAMIPTPRAYGSTGGGGLGEDLQEDLGPMLSPQGVQSLAQEAKRTLSYLEREFPDFAVVEQVHLVVRDRGLEGLGDLVADRLGLPATVVLPGPMGGDVPAAANVITGREGERYMAAYGHALHGSNFGGVAVPSMDLYGKERVAAKEQSTKRNFVGSILVSALGIAVGAAGWYLYSGQINHVQADTAEAKSQAASIRAETGQIVAARLKKQQQYKALRKEGAPVGPLMDYIDSCLEPGVGLTSVSVSPNLDVNLIAESTSEDAMIKTYENLQRCPLLQGVTEASYHQDSKKPDSPTTFIINAKTISEARIRMFGTPANKPPANSARPGSQAVANGGQTGRKL